MRQAAQPWVPQVWILRPGKPRTLLKKHPFPVRAARQSASQLIPHSRLFQPQLGRFRISTGPIQPVKRRARPRQRGMEGSLRSVRSRKNALDFCKGRMLGKDNSFEVVLDPARDPGADKRGLQRSGQVFSIWEDTGGASPLPTTRNSSRKGAGVGTAQLFQSIFGRFSGQTFSRTQRIPVPKSLRSRYPNLRHRHHAPNRLDIRQRIHLLPSIHPQHRSTYKEQRHIRPNLRRNHQPPRQRDKIVILIANAVILSAAKQSRRTCGCLCAAGISTTMGAPGLAFETWETTNPVRNPQFLFQSHQRRHSICRPGPQPALNRQPFVDMNLDVCGNPKFLQDQANHLPSRIPLAQRHPFIIRSQPDRRFLRWPRRNRHHIMQLQRLIDRAERVKTIRPRSPNPQSQIDLCV